MELIQKLTSRKAMITAGILLPVFIAVLALFVDWRQVAEMLQRANRPMLAAAALLLALGYLSYAGRWSFLLNRRLAYLSVFHVANIGTMINVLLPGRPGDAVRVLLLMSKCKVPAPAGASSIVVERWFEQIMRLAALGGAVIFGAGAHASLLTILGSVGYLVFSFLLMIFLIRRREWALMHLPPQIARLPHIDEDRARRWLIDLIEGLSGISSPRRLLGALFWSVLTWGLFWGFHFLSLEALHPYLPTERLLAISLGSLALVPPSAATVPGIYQISIVAPLTLVGYRRELLTTYSLVMNLVEMAVVILLGLWGTIAAGITLHQLFERTSVAVAEEVVESQHQEITTR